MRAGGARRSPHLPVAVAAGLCVGVLAGILVVRASAGAHAESVVATEAVDEAEPALELMADAAAAGEPDVTLAAAHDAGPVDRADAALAGAAPEDADEDVVEDADEDEVAAGDELGGRTLTLRFDVRPQDAQGLEITVDGQSVTGRSHVIEVEGRSRRVRVAARARGFLTWSRSVTVGRDRQIRIELERFVPAEEGPGGLIDL